MGGMYKSNDAYTPKLFFSAYSRMHKVSEALLIYTWKISLEDSLLLFSS